QNALFFFQAEDGIRDFHVTGVQTCALPISGGGVHGGGRVRRGTAVRPASRRRGGVPGDRTRPVDDRADLRRTRQALAAARGGAEIGRASCRERVENTVGAVTLVSRRVERTN